MKLGGGLHAPHWLILVVGAMTLSACGLDVYTLGGDSTGDDVEDDGGSDDDGGGGGDGGMDDGGPPDACVAFPETCDEADNDCDGETDEGFDLTMDPANCGSCGNRCSQPNAAGTCVDSDCEYECLPGFVDTDGNLDNGCDYACTVTNGGVEICDIADNDCDGDTDEGLDLDNDELNCGSCGNHCLALNAEPICDMGDCTFGACDPGFGDIIPAIAGCEYACPVNPAEAEDCDGVDDDCDGSIDDLPIPGLGADCADPGFEVYMGVGRCTPGVLACSFGVEVCQGFVRPLFDDAVCNTIDDDCDGPVDEDVDFTDPRHCGTCANVCNLANAIEGCVAGGCTIATCLPGFVDEDGLDSTGCEYACTPTGPETCDGLDNDCDGDFDLDDGDLTAPSNFCEFLGECAGTMPTCAADPCGGGVGWTCAYGGDAEVDTCGDLAFQETECDGNDNDCDGATDESYVALGDDCDDDGIGECRRTGELVCATTQDALTCNLTSPVVTPSPEECDNEDDDCDTFIDEDAPDDMVAVNNGTTTYYMYTYEASRPDADDNGFGNATHRSCSKPGVLPWRTVTHTEAAAACLAAGKRLCTEAEWEFSCGGPSGFDFPYGNTYDANACNGRDVDLDCTAPDSDEVALTGEAFGCPAPAVSECVSPTGAYDLSGNLREWTSTPVGGSAFRVRGGGFDNIDEGLRCDFSFIAFAPGSAFPNLGFRCCADTPDP